MVSCGDGRDRGPASVNLLELEVQAERALNSQERSLLLETCYAFRSKWIEFRQNFRGETFRFDYQGQSCERDDRGQQRTYDQIIETSLVHLLDSAPIVFDSPELLDYVRNMETHLHGRLSGLCQKAMRGETVTNQANLTGQEVAQYRLSRDGEFTIYEVGVAQRSGEGAGRYHTYETYRVLTRPKSEQRSYLGVVKEIDRHVRCADELDASFYQRMILP